MRALKSITQRYLPTPIVEKLMDDFRQMTPYGGYSGYRLCAISKAAGILSARRKSIKRGFTTGKPYVRKPMLVSRYGFRVERGALLIHVDSGRFESIRLNPHTLKTLFDTTMKVRSFTLT